MRRRRGSSGVSGRCCCDRTDRLPANTLQSDETCWVCTLTSSRLWVRRLLPNIHPAFLPSSPFTATRWEVEQLVSTSTMKTLWVNRVTNTNLVRRTRRSPPTINFNLLPWDISAPKVHSWHVLLPFFTSFTRLKTFLSRQKACFSPRSNPSEAWSLYLLYRTSKEILNDYFHVFLLWTDSNLTAGLFTHFIYYCLQFHKWSDANAKLAAGGGHCVSARLRCGAAEWIWGSSRAKWTYSVSC